MSTEAELLEAGVAAERLNLSPSGLRRVAAIYEAVHGPLPRKSGRKDQRGPRARLYPSEAVERLAAAQSFVTTERYASIEEGLRAYERGERPDVDTELVGELTPRVKAVQDELTGVLRGVLQDELRQRDADLEERLTAFLEAKFAELRSEVGELRRLPPGVTSNRIDRALEVEMHEGRVEAEQAAAIGAGGGGAEQSPDGLLVRAARWLERLLRGR